MADASCARMMSAFAPLAISASTSASCFSFEPWASAETYFAPAASSDALIAASSFFQRSSWKLDHETPTSSPFAYASVGAASTKPVAAASPHHWLTPPNSPQLVLRVGFAARARREERVGGSWGE